MKSGAFIKQWLRSGDVVSMERRTQGYYVHRVYPFMAARGVRFNLTFRRTVVHTLVAYYRDVVIILPGAMMMEMLVMTQMIIILGNPGP